MQNITCLTLSAPTGAWYSVEIIHADLNIIWLHFQGIYAGTLKEGVDKLAIEHREHEEQLWWGTLTMKENFADWTAQPRLSFIIGSWVITMTSSGATIIVCVTCGSFISPHPMLCSTIVYAFVHWLIITDPLIIVDAVLSHGYQHVWHKGCEIS